MMRKIRWQYVVYLCLLFVTVTLILVILLIPVDTSTSKYSSYSEWLSAQNAWINSYEESAKLDTLAESFNFVNLYPLYRDLSHITSEEVILSDGFKVPVEQNYIGLSVSELNQEFYLGLRKLNDLKCLQLSDKSKLMPKYYELLENMPSIEVLLLGDMQLPDLEIVLFMPNLQLLYLSNMELSNLNGLDKINVTQLHLENMDLGEIDLSVLKACNSLKYVKISNCTDVPYEELSVLSYLETLIIDSIEEPVDVSELNKFNSLDTLVNLIISNCKIVAMEQLSVIPNLVFAEFSMSNIDSLLWAKNSESLLYLGAHNSVFSDLNVLKVLPKQVAVDIGGVDYYSVYKLIERHDSYYIDDLHNK